eukprot:scaffold58898_cov16-Tisochrysis_lutea.AAC.1
MTYTSLDLRMGDRAYELGREWREGIGPFLSLGATQDSSAESTSCACKSRGQEKACKCQGMSFNRSREYMGRKAGHEQKGPCLFSGRPYCPGVQAL